MTDVPDIQPPDEALIIVQVAARAPSVTVSVVKAGETWRFDADGQWSDWRRKCGPEGYGSALRRFLGIVPLVHAGAWFALVGRVGPGHEYVVIGKGKEHTFTADGEFSVFANDAPAMRWNNSGQVKLTARRLAQPTPVEDVAPVPTDNGLLARWMRLVDDLQKTQGFLFIAVMLLGAGAILTLTAPGQDVLITTVLDRTIGHAYYFATLVLGLQAWYWARAIVEFRFVQRENWRSSWALTWIPRLFGIIPFIFLQCGLIEAEYTLSRTTLERPSIVPNIILGVGLFGFLLFMIFREWLTQALHQWGGRLHARGRSGAGRAVGAVLVSGKALILVGSLIAAAASMVVFLLWPVHPAAYLGTAAVALFALAMFIPPMMLCIQMGSIRRIPFTPLLIVWALVLSLWVDNHAIRLLPAGAEVADRPTIVEAFKKWRAQAQPGPDGTVPIFFVAAEGGASRAGYWTSEAMTLLDKQTAGAFSKHLFAISSVSGGSVGAVGYLASLHDNPALSGEALRTSVDEFAGADFLSPALAGMFFPDTLQRIVFPAFLPDRAHALEQAWEVSWQDHCKIAGRCHDPHLFERPFLSLWTKDQMGWLPMLLIGGAREEDGRRIITSSLNFADAIDADDFHQIVPGHDVRLSTAVSNGARFPVVSPGGTLEGAQPGKGGHILDGGYFDGAGVEALRELARATLRIERTDPSLVRHGRLRPIFVILENGFADPVKNTPALFAADILGPLNGLSQSKTAHGAHLEVLLARDGMGARCEKLDCPIVDGLFKPQVVFLRACNPAPLNWVLSARSRASLRDSLANHCDNPAKIADMAKSLVP